MAEFETLQLLNLNIVDLSVNQKKMASSVYYQKGTKH